MKNVLFILTLTFLLTKISFAQSILIFAQIQNTPDQMVGAEILKTIYNKIGISIQMKDMPGKRALSESSAGRVDGEVHRIFKIGEDYSTLVRVPTPINYIEPSVFSKNHNFKITDCANLKDYNIGIVRGVRHAELCTNGMDRVKVFNNSIKMMELLNANRIDIVITARINGLMLSKKMNLKSIHPLSPPLNRMLVYHYVHIKHKDLVTKLDKVIIEMQKSGELEILREKAIQKLFMSTESN